MITELQRELLSTRPERFPYITLYLPEFCALNMASIGLEVNHKGRYIGESELSKKVLLDPYTPLGPLVSLGTVGDIANTLEDPSDFLYALGVIFTTINTYATHKVRNGLTNILESTEQLDSTFLDTGSLLTDQVV